MQGEVGDTGKVLVVQKGCGGDMEGVGGIERVLVGYEGCVCYRYGVGGT
jgi:hypothetical protein